MEHSSPWRRLDALDRALVNLMRRWGVTLLRYSLALIFFWFGILKPLALSPADPLLVATVGRIPLFQPETWITLIGCFEMLIGVLFLSRHTVRLAVVLVFFHFIGTTAPLVLVPAMTFQSGHIPYAPTTEGQYIIKNLLILFGSMAVGGSLRRREELGPAADQLGRRP